MTEEEARLWIRERFGVPRETLLDRYAEMLCEEAGRQNLISASTLPQLWARHFVDSAQLLLFVESQRSGSWIDIGAGAGLPGLVIAALVDRPMILVEPRAKRVEFLRHAVEVLGLSHVEVVPSRIETFYPEHPAAYVSARAVTDLPALLSAAQHCTDSSTIWLLPKGRTAQSEVEAARSAWQGSFHVEPSITQPDSGIVIARKVRRK